MLTVESITELKETLSDLVGSDKDVIEKMLVALSEFKAIENQTVELKKIIKKLIEAKHLDKYIELNGSIYCLETLEEFDLIPASEKELTEIMNIEKEINQECSAIKETIEKSDNQLMDLYKQRGELLEKLFSDAKYKAVKNNKMLILQQEFEDNLIFLED